MTAQNTSPDQKAGAGPWRLLVLLGWIMFVLVHDHRIPGMELEAVPQVAIVVALMVASWLVMPNRRAELMGIAVVLAVGVIGVAANLTLQQKLAILGLVMLVPIAYALWLVRHASSRLRFVVMAVFAGVVMVEFIGVGVDELLDALTSAAAAPALN